MRLHRRHDGFSLIELLVALFVVVIITSLVTLNVNSGGQEVKIRAQVEQLVRTARFALDEAQLSGVDMGLLLWRTPVDDGTAIAWDWRQRVEDGWGEPRPRTDVFIEEALPPAVEVTLELEDFPAVTIETVEERQALEPQVVFQASGEVTPGSMDLRDRLSGELLWRIEWDMLGRFRLLPRGERQEERHASR